MGDRSWVCITVAVKDQEALFKAFNFDLADKDHLSHEEENGLLTVTFDEMSWGGYDNMKELAKEKVNFMAQNGAGGSYGEGLTVCHRGKLVEVPCLDAEPACFINRNGSPRSGSIGIIRRYYSLAKKVQAEFDQVKREHAAQQAVEQGAGKGNDKPEEAINEPTVV